MTYQLPILFQHPTCEGWILSKNHPTQGRRFVNARAELNKKAIRQKLAFMELAPSPVSIKELGLIHTSRYIEELVNGFTNEWEGCREDLTAIARHMAGGSVEGVRALIRGETKLAINFGGDKHHAMADYSSGFCTIADFAISAEIATMAGFRVAIFDCDVHHGDGTEALLKYNPDVLTFSVHQYGIFPNTGLDSDPMYNIYNYPLGEGHGDKDLKDAGALFIKTAKTFEADMIFIACGADGLADDPLGGLVYTVNGYSDTMFAIRKAFPDTPILFGGAGGYLPDTGTPDVWSESALALF